MTINNLIKDNFWVSTVSILRFSMRLSQSIMNLMVIEREKQCLPIRLIHKKSNIFLNVAIVLTRQVLSLSILLQQGRHCKAEEKNSRH